MVTASLSPPNIGKVFGISPIVVGQTSSLTITITNPNAGTALTGVAFSDSLPAGVTAPNASGSGCGGTVTVSANVISLVGGTLTAGGNCAIPVTVTGAQAQVAQWVNTINSVTSIEAGTNSTPATADITVNKASTTTTIVSDLPDPTVVGQPYTVTYSVSVTAPGAGTPTGTVTVSDGSSELQWNAARHELPVEQHDNWREIADSDLQRRVRISVPACRRAPHIR